MRETIIARVVSLASVLDSQGKREAPITVRATRATLRPVFRPRKRGGPLFLGDHELHLQATPKRDPDTVEMFGDGDRPNREATA